MPSEVARSIERLRQSLDRKGLMLLHDRRLPSVTTLLAGEPVSGSWWGHPKGKLIWNVMQVVDDEVVTAKLVMGKVTLLHRRHWADLAAVGSERADWQELDSSEQAGELLAQVAEQGRVRWDHVAKGADRKRLKRAVDQLERKLLVHAEQVHTESGKHLRVLTSWPRFVQERQLQLPTARQARTALESCVASWPSLGKVPLLPWLV